MLGGLLPPTVCPHSQFSFSLPLLVALCYPFCGLCNNVRNARPPHLVVLVAGVPLLLSLLHSGHYCQPLCLLAGCPGFHQVCEMSNCSVQLRQILCLLSYRPLHAAPPVAGGLREFVSPSPFSALILLHLLKYGCARSLSDDGCRSCCHLHLHVHMRVAPHIFSFSNVQVTRSAHSEFGHYSCATSLLVVVVACLLADESRQSRSLPSLYANPFRFVDFCVRPPALGSLVLGLSLRCQFDG